MTNKFIADVKQDMLQLDDRLTYNPHNAICAYHNRDVFEKGDIDEESKHKDCDGYISSIIVNGHKYKLRCEIVEVHPLICTRCGHPLELHNGSGQCPACGTRFSAVVSVKEEEEW